MRRLLSIWLRDWPIQRLRSELRRGVAEALPEEAFNEFADAPVILWKNDPRRGRLVVACCDRAAAYGVRAGIAIAQATELVQTQLARADSRNTPSIKPVAVEHDPIADSIAIEQIATTLQSEISPLVAVETVGQRPWAGRVLNEPDTVFCDLSGVTHLFGDETGVLQAVHRCLGEYGLVGKLAIADNAAAAWAHAHFNPRDDFVSTAVGEDLQGLAVESLRIETETQYTLGRLGIRTVGALNRLPRAGLARRLGEPLVNRIAESLGEVDVPLAMHHPSELISATHELDYPSADLEIIDDRIGRLTGSITDSMRRRGLGALRVACRLDLIDHKPLQVIVGLFAPTSDAKHLHCLTQSSVETLRIPSQVTAITVTVLQTGSLRTQQQTLFSNDDGAYDEHDTTNRSLARLVDSLTGRLGRDAVLGVRLGDNPLPEKAYRTYSLTDHRTRQALRRLPSKEIRRRAESSGYHAPGPTDARRRPMRLLRKPIRLTDSAKNRSQVHGPVDHLPVFRADGQMHKAVYHWGPERIETGWWDGPTIRRDYYRVETDRGHLWWVFRDLRSGEWFLHGRFF